MRGAIVLWLLFASACHKAHAADCPKYIEDMTQQEYSSNFLQAYRLSTAVQREDMLYLLLKGLCVPQIEPFSYEQRMTLAATAVQKFYPSRK